MIRANPTLCQVFLKGRSGADHGQGRARWIGGAEFPRRINRLRIRSNAPHLRKEAQRLFPRSAPPLPPLRTKTPANRQSRFTDANPKPLRTCGKRRSASSLAPRLPCPRSAPMPANRQSRFTGIHRQSVIKQGLVPRVCRLRSLLARWIGWRLDQRTPWDSPALVERLDPQDETTGWPSRMGPPGHAAIRSWDSPMPSRSHCFQTPKRAACPGTSY